MKEMKEKNCYSDSELAEFRKIIEGKIALAKMSLEMCLENINAESSLESLNKTIEGANALTNQNENLMHINRQKQFILNAETALSRIDCKTFGICKITGELIPKERIMANILATTKNPTIKNQAKKAGLIN